jgi:hypothetical protein
LGIFVALILVIARKSRKDAESRTVIARRQDFDIMAQINYHETEIKRLENVLTTYNRQQEMYRQYPQAPTYPAQYMNSFEIEHPRHM